MTKVLLVDDDLSFRRSLMIQLELEGCQVMEAESGADALIILNNAISKTNLPDVVVTDMKMPEMGGHTLMKHLRRTFPVLPVIMMSAFDPPEEVDSIHFLHKPFKIDKFMETLSQAVGIE